MGDKRPWPQVLRRLPGVKRTRGEDETETVTSQRRGEKITVAVDADLLQCCVCSGPLTTPLFQVYIYMRNQSLMINVFSTRES
jgi:E3 ubiquitin-protein ligase SIAH1